MEKRTYILIFLFFSLLRYSAQIIDTNFIVSFDKHKFGIGTKQELNPDTLVNRLTTGFSTDKEKFDAIFAWVAREISYDWWDYYSAGSSPKRIETILERKRAICLGYANLMDTLCYKAGITNVTVYGYAKDELFDVDDSLYYDNHAWNAVKLDGEWFVYDVTWSTGEPKYELTKKSKWWAKKRNSFKFKYKKKKVISKRRLRKIQKTSICGKKIDIPLYKLKWRFLNRLWYYILQSRKLKYKKKYEKGIKTNYYLSQPEVFAINHLPDDPCWSLCDINTMHKYESDKRYYSLNDSVYKLQERRGRQCAECDAWVSKNAKDRIITLKKKGAELNSRNYYLAGECDWNMSELFLSEARLLMNDSVKLMHYDSCLNYLKSSGGNYQRASWSAFKEGRKQKLKNRKKLDLLLYENAGHDKAFRSRLGITMNDIRSCNRMVSKNSAARFNWMKRSGKIKNMGNSIRIMTPKNDVSSRVASLQERIDRFHQIADSLKPIISENKNKLDSVLIHLALNIPEQIKRVDSMEYWFRVRSFMRYYLFDNYKKPIVDTTVKMYDFENRYFFEIDGIVYRPYDTLVALNEIIRSAIKNKNFALDQALKLKMELVKVSALSLSDFNEEKKETDKDAWVDICWMSNAYGPFLMLNKGLYGLEFKQRMVLGWINGERWVERRCRYFPIEKEWKRRYNKYNGIAKNNKRLTQRKANLVKKERKPVEKREKLRKAKK